MAAKSKKGDKPDAAKPDTGQNKSLAIIAQGAQSMQTKLAAAGIKVTRLHTVPMLLLQPGRPRLLVITGAIHKSQWQKEQPATEAGGKKKEPMSVCDVGDILTGEQLRLVVSSVIGSTLEDKTAFPDGDNGQPGYIGKTFYMEKLLKRPGKDYYDHVISEIEVPEGVSPDALNALAKSLGVGEPAAAK